ncbi:aminotransferase class I/II-fold pyridoxal phosphate-dependent enzyme [Macrococcus sp. DPC7161]|uniref:aminotransferase class I/II-fold pyridoxal phosphate-dependent enzyme n=1 Tax=Macrococcus sp. DPC7161 TaxID=2507060 RepID=UPI00100BE2D1|nr:aminotransferase class I/II-fold pyridoxal phosphate-dependent enzyme [Macrococcus sp. DPC7161]RXK19244.1 aminotransferase class I/II-fold pyridoxal phosphate-dependent enzyme [Macrococcus sp. DPC7161]
MPNVNQRIQNIEVPGTRQFANKVALYNDCIDLTLGQPDFDTPQPIKQAAIHAIEQKTMKYSHNMGLIELRQAISNYYIDRYNATFNPNSEITVTIGGSEGIDAILRAILDEGDEVIIPAPTYLGYEPIVELLGGKVKFIDTTGTDYILTKEALLNAVSNKTKAIILNYPTNPTGATYTKAQLDDLVDGLKQLDIFIVSDEIYAENTLECEHYSLVIYPEIRDRVLVVNGLSKSHGMTGWRIGYVVGDYRIIEEVTTVHLYNTICAALPSQYAAIEALTNQIDLPKIMNKSYIESRNYVYQRLLNMGLDVVKPKGAFYIFPSIKKYSNDSFQFANDLIESVQLAVVPGLAFGEFGEGHIRLSFACSMETLVEACNRLEQFINKLEAKK